MTGIFWNRVMPGFYRVFFPDGNLIGDADSIDGVVDLAKNVPPGRYRIDQVFSDPGSGAQKSQTWGAVIRSRNGRITLDAPSWID